MNLFQTRHTPFFKYFYLFCFIIYAGGAVVFARSLGDIRTIGNAFAIILTLILIKKENIHFYVNYFCGIIVFSLFAAITFVNNGLINPLWWSQWLLWLSYAYCICQSFKEDLFRSYEIILSWLCIISIPLWLLSCIDYGAVQSLVSIFEFSKPFSENSASLNMVIFTVLDPELAQSEFTWFIRNSGFAWEPGAFACFINIAIMCNIFRTNFNLKGNRILWLFIFTLFTTQSTTGLAVFIFIIITWLLIQRKYKYALLLIPVIIVLVNFPFVKDKFLDEFVNVKYVNLNDMAGDSGYALGRLYSLQLDWEEFLRHPLIGLGGYSDGTFLKKFGYDNIATISGIGKLLSMYGAIMTIAFCILLIKSSQYISNIINNKNGYLLIVVIIGSMIGYNIWTNPLMIAFWMYAFLRDINNVLLIES